MGSDRATNAKPGMFSFLFFFLPRNKLRVGYTGTPDKGVLRANRESFIRRLRLMRIERRRTPMRVLN